MTGLPDWIVGRGGYAPLRGFDVDGWWIPITCTNRGRHALEQIGVIFERTEDNAKRLADAIANGDLPPGAELPRDWRFLGVEWAAPFIAFRTLTDEVRADVRARGTTEESNADLYFGHGSVNLTCPVGCMPRIPRQDWNRILRSTWDSIPDPSVVPLGVDVSLYG